MTINIVIVDHAHLAGEADYPPLDINRYGWEQYPELSDQQLLERCWRAEIIVSVATEITAAAIQKMPKLKVLIVPGNSHSLVDRSVAEKHNIQVMYITDADTQDENEAQLFCDRVVECMNIYLSTD